ncbi:cell division protein FtsQ/DivIB [Shewanella amazonensis]|uniref:Cell division protein FtsQ n=1 Tax=Shewanella amazonensis (strain ATCC BAA-1098 / SB2B) TaxID=326297 RepID=A1S2G1_SHEAM|nr:cell division protein FtsQ [Shewanella amazonensis SB2B]
MARDRKTPTRRAPPEKRPRGPELRQRGVQFWAGLCSLNWYLITGFSFFLLVLAGLGYSGYRLHGLLNNAEALPIEALVIKGDRVYTTEEEIRGAMEKLMARSFFSADVMEIQQAIEALPWVYKASVRRMWPARIKVYLQEQQAAARWNGMDWVNEQGEVFSAPEQQGLTDLPKLSGPENMSAEVLTSYRQIAELLQINGYGLESLSLSPRHAWIAVLDNGITLELGREDKMARVQRFINVYPTLAKQPKAVARVDLRYDTGLAVGWNETKQESR